MKFDCFSKRRISNNGINSLKRSMYMSAQRTAHEKWRDY